MKRRMRQCSRSYPLIILSRRFVNDRRFPHTPPTDGRSCQDKKSLISRHPHLPIAILRSVTGVFPRVSFSHHSRAIRTLRSDVRSGNWEDLDSQRPTSCIPLNSAADTDTPGNSSRRFPKISHLAFKFSAALLTSSSPPQSGSKTMDIRGSISTWAAPWPRSMDKGEAPDCCAMRIRPAGLLKP